MVRRSVVFGVMALAVVAGMAARAQAQGRGPGGPGGPGGFGGFGGGDQVGQLLRNDAVLTEIEATDEQKAELTKVFEAARGQRGERPQIDFRTATEEERQKAIAEMREAGQKRAAELRAKVETVLLPHQVKRLDEIGVQVRGVQALTDAKVAEALKLSKEQQEEVAKTIEENNQSLGTQMRELFQGGAQGGDREAVREKITALRKEADAKVLAHLTADQQKAFEDLKGEVFEMPRPQLGGRGQGGPGAPGGRGQGGPGGRGQGGNRRPPADA